MSELGNIQFITTDHSELSHSEQCLAACKAGIKWIQLRMKHATDFDLEQEAIACKEICEDHKATFIVNDHVDVAKRVMADGVHLGKTDMSPLDARQILGTLPIIGSTANSTEDIINLKIQPIDYIGLGPLRTTQTKENLSPIIGIEGYNPIIKSMREAKMFHPVYAIGGVQLLDIKPLLSAGLSGVAVSSLLANAEDMKETFIAMSNEFEQS